MEKNVMNDNVNKVKEMILDEDKLVSYISLSKELCIHVNESKLLLNELIANIKQNQPNRKLHVNFIISGITDGNSAHTLVCTEEDSVKLRKKFFKLIFFDHVYSVSKNILDVDKVAHLAINTFDDVFLYNGLVKSSMCSKYTSDEIGNLKSNSQNCVITELKPDVQQKKNVQIKNNISDVIDTSAKLGENKHKIEIKKEILSPKKELTTKMNHEKKSINSQKGIAGFFGKSNGTINKKSAEKEKVSVKLEESGMKAEKNDVVRSNSIVNKNTGDVKKSGKLEETESKTEKNCKDKKDNLSVTKKGNKDLAVASNKSSSLNHIKKNAKVDAKRKRVLHVSDSESDEDPFETEPTFNNNSDDEIPPTPSINTVKITSGIINPKKRRKIVDKTYTDDEGYILTKKVEVYESCSENEEEPSKQNDSHETNVKFVKKTEVSPEKPKNGAKNKKKATPPQKGKQSTLMNFFKRS